MNKKTTCENPNDFQLNDHQIRELITLARFNRNDIFFDLGSGNGGVVISIVNNTNVKKAIGIELDSWYYEEAKKNTIERISTRKNLKRIDFWRGYYDSDEKIDDKEYVFNYKDATIVFASIVEEVDDLDFYKRRLSWKKVSIIKKDLPLVGFDSVPNRNNHDCWFFLMKPTHKRIGEKQWIRSVCEDFDSIDDVYDYYYGQWYRRSLKLGESEKEANREATTHLLSLETLVSERF